MKTSSVVVGTLLLIFIKIRITQGQQLQRIREGRCPPIRRRTDCPAFVWDECTCDSDCSGKQKCCLDGCKYACLDPDEGTPSVRNKADVVFIMDSSGSIGPDDYNREKQFVKDLTNVFQVSPTEARISTIIYSDDPKLIFDFDTFNDKQSINTAIDDLEYLGNRTRIDKALAMAMEVFSKSRPAVPRIAFVLTDGKQTDDYDAKPLDIAVRPLHDLGVHVYVIGIGTYVDPEELRLLARRQEDVFTVDSFELLLQQTYRIVNRIDTYDAIPPLEITADIMFLVDSSSAIPRATYGDQLNFLQTIVNQFRISPRYVRATVISYGNTARLSIPFGTRTTNAAMNRSIDSLPYVGGQKRIDRALWLANQTFLQARRLVPKILLILTHGGQLADVGTNLRLPVKALRDQGVSIFAIAIGDGVDYSTLNYIVENDNLIVDKSYKSLEPYLPPAASYIRVKSDFSTPLSKDAAVVFLVDTSEEVETMDFKRQREFVISLAKAFEISKEGVRASVITYGKYSRPTVQFKDSSDVDKFINAMIRTSQIKGRRMIDQALLMAARMFRHHDEVAPRAVILFTSGPHAGTLDQLKSASKRVTDLGALIYVVAIGPSVANSQIEELVSSSDDIKKLPSFMDLQSEIHFVGRYVSLQQVPGPGFIADVVFLIDASSSVGVVNFRRQKDFVKAVAQALNFGEQATRASLVVYSSTTRQVTDFNSHRTLGRFNVAVDGAPYLRRGRRVDTALTNAARLLSRARPGIPRITVLITSGRRDSGTPIKDISRQLELVGAKSFVVTIGALPDLRDYLVLSKQEDILRLQSFVDLPRKQKSFSQHIISSFDVKEPTPTPSTPPDKIPLNFIADVIFIMDSSSSVSSRDYSKEKEFVKYLATYLNVSPGNSRAALITYGNAASEVIEFDIKRLRADFESAVEKAPFVGRNRRIDRALEKASQMMANVRPWVRKIVILLTSGKQSRESGSKTPGEAAIPLLDKGVYNYVVAIGQEPDISELRPVVQQPAQIFRMTSFDDLEPRKTTVGGIIVETSTGPLTDIIADIIFILDSSNDVTRDEYNKEKSFIKEFARYLNVAPGKSRTAVITYGQSSDVLVKYGGYDSLTVFDVVINRASYIGGTQRMDLALDDAGRLLSEAKRCIPRWVILLTAGRHPSDPRAKSLLEASKPVRDQSDKVYVVAIGNKPDPKELKDIVKDPKDIFSVGSFQSLKSQARVIATTVANRSDVDLCVIKTFQATIVFLVDTTSSIGTLDFRRQKEFVKSVAKSFNVCQDSSQAAIITYGSLTSQKRPTDIYKDLSALEQAVDKSQYMGGLRRLHLAVDTAEQLLRTVSPSQKRIVVILTGGQPLIQDALSLKQSFKTLRNAGNGAFVVAIGNNYDKDEFLPAVDWPEDIFSVSSFDNLLPRACSISKAIAKRTDTDIPRDFMADVIFIMDSSVDVSRADYEKEKDFIESLAGYLRLSTGRTRAAVLTYGYTTTLVAEFDSYETLQTFNSAVDGASYIGGNGRLDYAFEYASRQLIDTSRQLVPKIVLLLTAGRLSPDQSLRLSAQPLHDYGFKVFVAKIGDKPDVNQLLPTVKDKAFVISVPSFDDLSRRALPVAQKLSKHTDPELPADFPGADVLFMVDSSSDISSNNYEKQKDLVKNLIETLDSFSSKSRISFITYGNRPRVVYDLDNNMNSEAQQREIDSVQPMGGRRRIDRALEEAVRMMQNSRPDVPKIILLVAAGKQIEQNGVQPLSSYGTALQRLGVDAFVLGIGKDIGYRDLGQVVRDAKNVFLVQMFQSLNSIDRQLAYEIVTRTVDGMIKTDVIFVMDSSSEVSQSDYGYEKEAVKSMARSLKVPSGQSRASVITYGNFPSPVVKFDGYKSFPAFENFIDRAQRIGGRRRIDLALEDAGKLLREARPSVRQNVILLTSGRTHPLSRDLYVSAQRIFGNNADLLVIAVGRRPNFKELTAIVQKPKHVYNVSSFSDLRRKSNEITKIVSQMPDKPTIYNNFVADIVFLMDSSLTVEQKVYDRQKNFIKSMVRSLNLSTDKSRVAVVNYGGDSVEVVRFSSPQDVAAIENRVDNARRVGRKRDIAEALQFSASLLEKSRPDVSKVIIFLTSGSELYLTSPSQVLRDHGADRYVIAIGSDLDEEELTPIIDEPRDMFTIRTPPELTWKTEYIIDEIIKRTVTRTSVLPLDFDADVLFLVDSSSDVSQENYNREKNFVKSLAFILNLKPGKTRAAVVIYGNFARTVIRFTDYASLSSFFRRIDTLPFLRGRRRLDSALIEGGSVLDTARPSADKVAILLTAGRHTQEVGAPPLNQAVESIRSHNAKLFVVAIGQRVDETELRPLTREPIVVSGFNVLIRNSIRIAKDIKNITDQTEVPKSPGADIVFLVDSSSGVTEDNFTKEKAFVTSLAKQLNFGSDKTRVGIISYSDYATLAARFDVVKNEENLQRLLDGIRRLQRGRRIDRGLIRAAQLFGESRPNVRQVLVLLTSGRHTSNVENPFRDAVQRLKTKGVDRFVVAIGPNPDPELTAVVERREDVISVFSFDSLQPQVIPIARHIKEEKIPPGFKADIIFLIDSAFEVTTNNFNKQKEFIKDLSAFLNLSSRGSRVAIILYASSPSLKMALGTLETPESLSRGLDRLAPLTGTRRMDRALEFASLKFDNKRPQAVRKIVVLFTSGKQAGGGKPLNEAVKRLQEINAETYVVAIGSQVSESELQPVVSRRNDIIRVPSFDILASKVKPVADQIINGSRPIPPEFKSDILFIMDSSSPVSRDDFQTQKDVVKSIMKSFHVRRGQSRAAVITYGRYSEKLLRFNSYLSLNDIESVVDTATSIGGSPRIDEVLVDAADVLRDAIQSIPRIVVMFTSVRDLTDRHKKAVDKAAEVIHDTGARVYVIAFGKDVDDLSLKKLADSQEDIFKVPTIKDLNDSMAVEIFRRVELPKPVVPMDFTGDVIFLVDSSSEVSEEQFKKEKHFVASLAKTLNLRPAKTRGSAITYGRYALVGIEFNDHPNPAMFEQALQGLYPIGYERRMDKALQKSVDMVKVARSYVPKIVVLLTAGRQSSPRNTLPQSVKSLKDHGTSVFVVGIGSRPDSQELRAIVEEPGDVLRVSQFNDFSPSRTRQIARHIVSRTENRTLDVDADIVFLLDASSFVSRENFVKEKDFVKSMAKVLNVAPGSSRAAVILIGTFPDTKVTFNEYRTLRDFNELVDKAQSFGGSRRIDRALEEASKVLVDRRRGVPHVVVLVTGGKQSESGNNIPFENAVKPLDKIGAHTFVVAIGHDPDTLKNVLPVPSFNDLQSRVYKMARQIKTTSEPKPANISADIIFLMDSSTSVDRGGFDKQKNFVKSLAKYFNVSPTNSRATVVAYGNTTRTVVKFNDYQSETNFNDMLDRQPWIGGDRRIDRALRTAESLMLQARSEVPKILILLTAGRQPRSPDVTPIGIAAQPLRNMGIKNIVVSVGSEIDRKDLLGMVQSSDDIFSVALFDDLRYEVQPVVKYAVNFFELPIFDIKAEVLFLLDASDQTGRENFEKQKTFIKLLARSLNVSPGKSTAALIAYSTIATINIPLGSYNTVQEFERNVDRTRFLGNSRKMYRALEEAAYLFQNATESDAERKVILITGGRQTSDEDEEPLEKFKKLLLDVGALPFIVAIGKDHDNQTLRAVVEDPGDIFRVPTFIELSSSVSSTAARVANRKAPPIIQDEYIIFLMDSSSTVQREQFQRQKNFIKSLAEYLQVGSSDKTKAAVINYGSVPSGIITFDDYTNIRGFKSGIDGIIPVRGSRRIDQALGEAAVILRGIDQSSKKILVLLTAGQQAKESDVTPLDVAIRPIRDMKSHMYVVALGNDPSTPELRPLVTKLEDMFRVPFNFMERIVPSIVDHIRKENPYPGPTHDVVFLMDTSDVSRSDFYQEILFVKSLARELSVTASEFQKAVVSYGNKYSQVVRFDSYDSLRDFYTAIDASVYQAGARRMDRAFEAASMILSSRNPASKKTVVLLTGGSNSREADPNSLARSVQPLFKMEATVIVLAFGNRYDVQELLPTVKHPKDVRPVPQAYDLVRYVSEISKRIINGPDEPKTPKMDADILFIMDSSYEVNQEEYKSEKDFIKSLIRSLNVSLDTSRAALISYGDLGSLNSRFIGLKSLSDFDKLVDNATYVGGERRIDRALEKSTQILNEARAGSSKFVIFLTGGRQASSGKPLDEVVGPLRENGVKTYVITIGKKSDAQELRPLVASPEDLVSLHSFKELNSQISKIASHISEKAVCLRPDYILDVVFLMDTSTEVDDLSLDKEKAFVKLLAKCLNVLPGKSRASVITFGTTTSREIDFNSYESTQVFESLVDRISSIGGDRRIDKALEAAAEVVENSPPSVPKLVVLLTSGPQPANALSFSEAAIPLHSIGAMFYIVSIANDLDKKYYEALVDHPSQVSQASSFGSLNYVLPKVTQGVEQGASSRMHLNADVVFLMDASTAENTRYFQSQKDLIKSIARSIGSSPAKLRASLVIYSSSTTVLASLNSYTNLQRFEIDVDRAPYLRGTRRMDFALAAAALQLSQSRPNAAKIVILITTGLQAQVVGMTPLDEASKPLREANANIFVIGIGKQPDLRELVPVTNNPVKIIPTPDRVIVNLHLWLRQLRQQVNNEKESPLIYKADLIFLLDSSNDVGTKVFKEQKDFIKSIVGKFLIASNKTRVAVVRYSSRASSVITFSTFDNLLDLVRGIDSIRYIGGIRRMDAALKEANKLRETARSEVPIYVIFLTAGRQASTAVSTPLDRAAQPILDSTARMFVVGIGSRPEEMELFSMVERSRDVFRFPSEKMKEEVPLFVINMASQTGATVPRDFKADILFLVDSSQTISKRKFLQELEFVKAFARKFDVSPEKSRVGVITFGNTPILSIRFEDYGNILSFSEGVNRVPYQGGQKSLNNALVFAARVLDLSKTRPKADKILVLLTDGQQPLGYDPKEGSVEALRQLGVHINVIGAGGNVSMQELRKLTLSPDDLFYSRTFDALILQAPIVFKRTMNVVLSHHQLQHGVFLLESSLFRTRGEFESQINFVKSIAKRLQVSPTGTRAGVILYGDEPKLSIGLNDYSTLPELYNLLDNLAHESGGRQLHKALTLAGETLQKSPQEIPKFVVVILEGQQYSSGSLLLRDAVKPLQALGVTIYVVGIGEKLNRQELYTMVQTSRYIIQVPRFTELLRQMEFIAYRIETTITDPCHETLDVGFVIDASGSVGMDPFSREKNFVKLVSRRFAATSPNTRLGLLVFSDTPKLFVDFADYESKTIEQFQANVAQATFQDGRSRIDLALRAASQDFFTNRRSGVPRVLILVSDGRQSEDPGYYPLATAVKPLQAQRVRIVGVGFGDSVDVENLKEITGSKDRILLDQEINDIDRLQMELVSKACEV